MASDDTNTSTPIDDDLLICVACGTEFDQPADQPLDNCVICDDPRQYVPPTGQTFTTHRRLATTHVNTIHPIPSTPNLYSFTTTPKFAIGQRAILIKNPSHGNILWDCLTLLDAPTITWIKQQGGLAAIVISHPHYYASHLRWGWEFGCPVFLSGEDVGWVQRIDRWGVRRLLPTEPTEIVPGVTAITTGGHFPGSLVLHDASASPSQSGAKRGSSKSALLIADTLVTVPSALYSINRPPGTTSYGFYWSIPNMIPLPPSEMSKMWAALKGWEFGSTHGAFVGLDVRDEDGGGSVKERVRESMRIQAGGEGWVGGNGLGEEWP